jgi:D-3-phosphoglycerate dehydrogenase
MKIVAVEPIGISQDYAKELETIYANKGHEFVVYPDRNENSQVLIERMKDADVVIVSNIPLRKEVLQECKNLKFLNVAFTGLDHIDQDYCKENNILIRNASGYATQAVAELAVGLMLDVYRKITEFDQATRQLGTRNNILGRELRGKTVAIIGTGAIGLATAKILQAFGCKLIAYSRTQRQEAKAMGIEYLSLEEAVKQADIISLHTPLTKDTQNLISKEILSLCKPSAILINTARGAVIDNLALANALNENRISGAGIDVYEKEPPLAENHPLLSAKNAVLLPHVAYATRESFDIRIDIILNNLNEYINE